MSKQTDAEEIRQLEVLEALEEQPDARQIDLASQLGVAVGTVNWILKRMAQKGYVKIKRIGQWNWQYLLTPKGVAEKAKLTQLYLKESMRVYRQVRSDAREMLQSVQDRGYGSVRLIGKEGSDLIDICKLTALELGLQPVNDADLSRGDPIPAIKIDGKTINISWPSTESGDSA